MAEPTPNGEDIATAIQDEVTADKGLPKGVKLALGEPRSDVWNPNKEDHTLLAIVTGIANAYQAKLDDLEARLSALE